MKNIYNELVDVQNEIEPNLFKATFETLNKAVDKGFGSISYDHPDFDFVSELKHNNGVFAAFKTHRWQNDIAKQLLTESGELKSFEQFKTDTWDLMDAHGRRWLRTEYDTAVIRARMAARFREFQRDADLYPNLKWTPSTSVILRDIHEKLYGLILSITHPFWLQQYPGSLWNCKCGITNTDEPENSAIYHLEKYDIPTPPAGLEGNPAFTGRIYSRNNAYEQNPYPGADDAVTKLMSLPEFTEATFKLKLWVEKVISEAKARNVNTVVGSVDKKTKKFLKAHKITVNDDGIFLSDNKVIHMRRDVKKHAPLVDDIARLNGYLQTASIYYDLTHSNLIYFIDSGKELVLKYIVQPNYTTKIDGVKKEVCYIVTGGYVNRRDMAKKEYIKIRD